MWQYVRLNLGRHMYADKVISFAPLRSSWHLPRLRIVNLSGLHGSSLRSLSSWVDLCLQKRFSTSAQLQQRRWGLLICLARLSEEQLDRFDQCTRTHSLLRLCRSHMQTTLMEASQLVTQAVMSSITTSSSSDARRRHAAFKCLEAWIPILPSSYVMC